MLNQNSKIMNNTCSGMTVTLIVRDKQNTNKEVEGYIKQK